MDDESRKLSTEHSRLDREHDLERELEAAETLYSQLQGYTSTSQAAPSKLPEAASSPEPAVQMPEMLGNGLLSNPHFLW